jgi:hypothetical protein
VKKTFQGTPYAYLKTEAVYAQLDAGQPPAIYFVYWLALRSATDPERGNTSLNFAALQVAGVLSYILEIPQSGQDRARPGMGFTQVLAMRGGNPGIAPPLTPAQQQSAALPIPVSTTMPPAATTQAAVTRGDTGKAVLLVGLGVAAALGGYQLWTRHA